MPSTDDWIRGLGFKIWNVPGISRAWRFDFSDERYALVTDIGGFDLPPAAGPFCAVLLSKVDELIDAQPYLANAMELTQWLGGLSPPCAAKPQMLQRLALIYSKTTQETRSKMKTGNLGYPRIGSHRELKKLVEQLWRGEIDEAVLLAEAAHIRAAAWRTQTESGCDFVPSNDFSFYDQVLDTTAMLGAVPERFSWTGDRVDLVTYFAMARGRAGVAAMEMTKWFDTNYHYIVPELKAGQTFRLASTKAVDEFKEAQALGITTRPVLLGPVTYLSLAKMVDGSDDVLSLLNSILAVYEQVLKNLVEAGAEWVQIDEPILATQLSKEAREGIQRVYAQFAASIPNLRLMLTTYFGDLRENTSLVASLPVAGVHVDLVRGRGQLRDVIAHLPADRWLSMGVVDGRNIWRCDLDAAFDLLTQAVKSRGAERLIVAPSCSLLHVPHDLDLETKLDPEVKSWLAFAKQKLNEIHLLAKGVNDGAAAVSKEFEEARTALTARAKSPKVKRDDVRARCEETDPALDSRNSPFSVRQKKQRESLGLPSFPTTTIGSFPQTAEIRKARADFKAGKITEAEYERFLEKEIAFAVASQGEIGLDVLVHGEPERNDMVEYFGEQLDGFAFTQNGWVQSYGSRCVKPPVIFGDVSRPHPMTVRWSKFAQSLTTRMMKGMLTGPVTILQWSFVRDDQPRSETCRQIAFALRDEVVDLEKAGIRIIQIDEPALREGLPLRAVDWDAYLQWACECFRIAASGVVDETQIHTHMCYAEFNDILPAIASMDADVISMESSRSRMELLAGFRAHKYPNEIGPGVYDIHSPRVPTAEEILELLRAASQVFSPDQLWVNPDCGLKTRGWPEVRESLRNMVAAAQEIRHEITAVV